MTLRYDDSEIQSLFEEVLRLRGLIVEQAQTMLNEIGLSPGTASARQYNLALYIALRQHDLTDLQKRLSSFSISSLAHSEANVMSGLEGVLALLGKLSSRDFQLEYADFCPSEQILSEETKALFGPQRSGHRSSRIMVTLPTQAAWNGEQVKEWLKAGADCFRINCAHDNESEWRQMVKHVRKAQKELGIDAQIMFDLAGHKLRTNDLVLGPAVVHLKVSKKPTGKLLAPAEVLFYHKEISQEDLPSFLENVPHLPLPKEVMNELYVGDVFVFEDARGKKRLIRMQQPLSDGTWKGVCEQNCYLVPKMEFRWQRISEKGNLKYLGSFALPEFDGQPVDIRVRKGERILISRTHRHCHAAKYDENGREIRPVIISITLPEVLDQLEEGQSVWFDDGKLGCRIENIDEHGVWLRVDIAGANGVKIKADKGVNFPETVLQLPPLSEKDEHDLHCIAEHADMVALSFVQKVDDIEVLQQKLQALQAGHLPIIAKIETREGVRNLGSILLKNVDRIPFAVMIARGDLAVELGSVRLAEIQEDILWLCAAAQVPVIWATQVLETLNKSGVISRPEITDAAMSVRAECVMLNKGAFLGDTLRVLDNILSRMEHRQRKKLNFLSRWSL
ncbi:pyruvate kinase [Thiomicrorhabdus sp.]|uniref:pyruvate kinase n=1 Tax=Thiomicrorhabdus sp. TaxID=2039724 RepID=UPI0029C67103|nr:pyruvate kinase [Thiomicrorhabdus sp.]